MLHSVFRTSKYMTLRQCAVLVNMPTLCLVKPNKAMSCQPKSGVPGSQARVTCNNACQCAGTCRAKRRGNGHRDTRHETQEKQRLHGRIVTLNMSSAKRWPWIWRFANSHRPPAPQSHQRERPLRDVPRHKPHLVPTVAKCGEAPGFSMHVDIISWQVASVPILWNIRPRRCRSCKNLRNGPRPTTGR